MSKLFLLEDDLSLINGLSFAFQKAGYDLDIARTLQEAENLWQEGKYDLLILDVSLPDGSGFSFCETIRQASQVPIIFLTASDAETSIIMGLDIGGDDYITMEHPDIILSAEQIMGRLWDCDGNFVEGSTLAVYIRRLREKVEDEPTKPARIVTVRRMGYKWNTGGSAE